MTWKISPASHLHKHWIFAFYGYGQQASVFDQLEEICAPHFGFIIFDLPYEPLAEIPKKHDFEAEIQKIVRENNIEQITGISYSIGSRYNLVLAEMLPGLIRKIILLAPDGILINRWNRLATSTLPGRAVFRYLMLHPQFYINLLQILYAARLLPMHLFAFIKWHVRNHENAMRVYHTWMNMKYMLPDLPKIKQQQKRTGFPIIAFFGKNDFVIREKVSRKLQKEIPAAKIIMLEKDHNLLDEHLIQHIASYL